jgi:predicted ribonuclease toxin of YeeF-YezG toxin-antitoxin module
MNLTLDRCRVTVPVKKILMRDVFRPVIAAGHHAWKNKYGRSRKIDYNKTRKMGRELVFDKTFEKYLQEVEEITHRPLHPYQREQLKYHLNTYSYTKLSPDESHQHRREFNGRKSNIIADWEKMTGNKWPTYDKPIYNKSGKMIRKQGSRYDAHHLIECSWQGENEAWNMHPAKHPSEHQLGIHAKGSYASQIFNK